MFEREKKILSEYISQNTVVLSDGDKLLYSEHIKKHKAYSFKELHPLCKKELKKFFEANPNILSVHLYGSYVEGDYSNQNTPPKIKALRYLHTGKKKPSDIDIYLKEPYVLPEDSIIQVHSVILHKHENGFNVFRTDYDCQDRIEKNQPKQLKI